MKKALKVFYIIAVNLLLLCLCTTLIEFAAYKKACNIFLNQPHDDNRELHFSYEAKLPNYLEDIKSFFNGEEIFWGRLPDGLEYKDKPPIVVFGCSFAYGYGLNYDQTFSYKLAHLLKRPVYNRAAGSWGPQHMYYQTLQDSFYEDTDNADTYIYIMIEDHLMRQQLERFFVVDEYVYLHYKKQKSNFIMDNYDSKISNFIRGLYIRRIFNQKTATNYKKGNPKELERVNNLSYEYIKASKENNEKRLGKKINFVVIYFEKNDWVIPGKETLTEKLNNAGIQVFSIKELTDENLDSEEYNMKENGHPKEKTWDLLTPLIAEKIGLTN